MNGEIQDEARTGCVGCRWQLDMQQFVNAYVRGDVVEFGNVKPSFRGAHEAGLKAAGDYGFTTLAFAVEDGELIRVNVIGHTQGRGK